MERSLSTGPVDRLLARPTFGRAVLLSAAVILFTVCATGVALAVPGDLVEMEVLGVVPLESEAASILVLRQKGAGTLLPIFVGRAEANEIQGRIKDLPTGPGRSADLVRKSIEALGGKVLRVVIEGAGGNPFRAHVALEQGRAHRDVEARPSDSVALALASRAPIYATRHLIAESGLSEQELGAIHPPAGSRGEDLAAAPVRAESF